MMKIVRPTTPIWLDKNWKNWGQEYANKLKNNSKYQFQWKQYEKQRVNHLLLPLLKKMTANHCSFCDGFPMGQGMIKETIEHFRPKNLFPNLSYQWENLFLACSFCQEKGNQFDDLLLKPDEGSYGFDKYFIFNFRTFEIEVRKDIKDIDKKRAETTLNMYKLNDSERPKSRKQVFDIFHKINALDKEVNDFSYRYMF